MSDHYLVVLAYHANNPDDLAPTAARLRQFERALSLRYDGAIRQGLAGDHLDPAELRFVSVLAVLSSGQTAEAQVRDACDLFLAIRPKVPPSGSSAFVAREALELATVGATPAFRAAARRQSTPRGKPAGARDATKRASGERKAARPSGRRRKSDGQSP